MCHNYKEVLQEWTKSIQKGLSFAVPVVWREPRDRVVDCYFCRDNTEGIGKKNWRKILDLSIPFTIRPIPHCNKLPIPDFSGFAEDTEEESSKY